MVWHNPWCCNLGTVILPCNTKPIHIMQTKIMSAIENALNGGIMSDGTDRIRCANDFLMHGHRYLQGEMFDFVISYIKLNAKHWNEAPNRWFDGRNEHVGMACARICESVDFMNLTQYDEERLAKAFPFAEAGSTKLEEDYEKLYRREAVAI